MRRYFWMLMILIVALLLAIFQNALEPPPHQQTVVPGEDFLFCFWNVENLFDDQDDGRKTAGDSTYDPWFAQNPDLLQLKLDKHTEVLLALNNGRGPDILAIVEVESERAAELLRQNLNAGLPEELHYGPVVMKEITGLRNIAPAVLTRLPVVRDRTRLLDRRLRILESHLEVDGQGLTLITSHWTSRIRDDSEKGRINYADKIYGRVNAIFHADPAADVLICGDFNDNPDDPSVSKHLHTIGDANKVRASSNPLYLFNLFASKDPDEYGTHYYSRWFIFDQIVVSPGLLQEQGWRCDIDSVQTIRTLHHPKDRLRRPWRFGSPSEKKERGYSDHFPVTVQLKVPRTLAVSPTPSLAVSRIKNP